MSESPPLHRHVVRRREADGLHFPWGSITWLDNAELTGSETLTFGVVRINAGQSNPEHLHPNCDEVLYVVSGQLYHTIGVSVHHLRSGDLIHIPAGARHRCWNPGDEPCEVVVAYNTGRREVVGEFDEPSQP